MAHSERRAINPHVNNVWAPVAVCAILVSRLCKKKKPQQFSISCKEQHQIHMYMNEQTAEMPSHTDSNKSISNTCIGVILQPMQTDCASVPLLINVLHWCTIKPIKTIGKLIAHSRPTPLKTKNKDLSFCLEWTNLKYDQSRNWSKSQINKIGQRSPNANNQWYRHV